MVATDFCGDVQSLELAKHSVYFNDKKLYFGLIRQKNLLQVDLGVSTMPLDELSWRFNELSSTVAFSYPLSHKTLTGEEPGEQS